MLPCSLDKQRARHELVKTLAALGKIKSLQSAIVCETKL